MRGERPLVFTYLKTGQGLDASCGSSSPRGRAFSLLVTLHTAGVEAAEEAI